MKAIERPFMRFGYVWSPPSMLTAERAFVRPDISGHHVRKRGKNVREQIIRTVHVRASGASEADWFRVGGLQLSLILYRPWGRT